MSNLDLSKIIKQSVAKAQASPTYKLTPKRATLIEYRLQQCVACLDGTTIASGWGDLGESRTGLEGYSDLRKMKDSMQKEFPMRAYRIVGIVEVE